MLRWANATTCITNDAFSVGFVSVLCLCSMKLISWQVAHILLYPTYRTFSTVLDQPARRNVDTQQQTSPTHPDGVGSPVLFRGLG